MLTDCERGDLYFAAAAALQQAADIEPSKSASIGDLKDAAHLFVKAAECYTKCGESDFEDDPLNAYGAFGRAVLALKNAERLEGLITDYYKNDMKDPPEEDPEKPRSQRGKAEKRKRDDAMQRAEAEKREREARERYLVAL